MKVWNSDRIKFLVENYANKGVTYCSRELGLSKCSIQHKAVRLKLRVSKETKSLLLRGHSPKYRPEYCHVKASYFINPQTPEAAYILGFIWADGYLVKGRKEIRIEILKSDFLTISHLFLPSGKWTSIPSRKPRKNRKDQLGCCTCNAELYDFLISMDYKSKSNSACKILSVIPKELHPYWFQGLFDGDGCFYVKETKPRIYQTSIAGPYDQDWSFVENLYKELKINGIVKRRIQQRKNQTSTQSSVIRTSAISDLIKIGDYIYTHGCIGFKRKYEKYLSVKNRVD